MKERKAEKKTKNETGKLNNSNSQLPCHPHHHLSSFSSSSSSSSSSAHQTHTNRAHTFHSSTPSPSIAIPSSLLPSLSIALPPLSSPPPPLQHVPSPEGHCPPSLTGCSACKCLSPLLPDPKDLKSHLDPETNFADWDGEATGEAEAKKKGDDGATKDSAEVDGKEIMNENHMIKMGSACMAAAEIGADLSTKQSDIVSSDRRMVMTRTTDETMHAANEKRFVKRRHTRSKSEESVTQGLLTLEGERRNGRGDRSGHGLDQGASIQGTRELSFGPQSLNPQNLEKIEHPGHVHVANGMKFPRNIVVSNTNKATASINICDAPPTPSITSTGITLPREERHQPAGNEVESGKRCQERRRIQRCEVLYHPSHVHASFIGDIPWQYYLVRRVNQMVRQANEAEAARRIGM